MKKQMICVIYVDDTIFAGPRQQDIDQEVKLLGIIIFFHLSFTKNNNILNVYLN